MERGSDEPPAMDAATRLCTSCGMCCTGALHNVVFLPDEEVEKAEALGLLVSDMRTKVFALPCPRLSGTVCSVYDRCPSSCHYYRCQLLRQLDEGMVDLDQALDKVQVARSLIAKAREVMPEGMTLPEARAIALGRAAASRSGYSNPELKLRMTALIFYLDRHFMNDDDGKYLELGMAGEMDPREATG